MSSPSTNAFQPVRAARGRAISCRGWQQEGALRMLMNSVDPEVAELPEELIPTGGVGKVARDWESFRAIVAALRAMNDDEAMAVKGGVLKGILPRDASHCYVQINGDWSYVGTQGVLPTALALFSAAAGRHFGGTLAGRLVVCGGMGGMGGAIPLAVTANGGAFLGIDVDAERIKRRVKAGYCDLLVNSLDEALRILKNAVRKREAASVGLIGNCADVIPELARRGVVPDLLTDQTPADEPATNYLPQTLKVEQARELRRRDPEAFRDRARDALAAHVRGMLDLQKLGAVTFEYDNGLRKAGHDSGVGDVSEIADGVEIYVRPMMTAGRAQLLWVALSGEASDVVLADQLALQLFQDDEQLRKWMELTRHLPRFQGLPARACRLAVTGLGEFAARLNKLVADGEMKAPIALLRSFPPVSGDEAPGKSLKGSGSLSGASWIAVPRTNRITRYNVGMVVDGTPGADERISCLLSATQAPA